MAEEDEAAMKGSREVTGGSTEAIKKQLLKVSKFFGCGWGDGMGGIFSSKQNLLESINTRR